MPRAGTRHTGRMPDLIGPNMRTAARGQSPAAVVSIFNSHFRLCQSRGLAVRPGAWSTLLSMTDTPPLAQMPTTSNADSQRFYHGTRADLRPGDLIQPGYLSNYCERKSRWVYFSETLNAATWGAELARG